MPELTRRRDQEAREECWHIYYGDVRAGVIALRVGIPHDEAQGALPRFRRARIGVLN
jgi:hypothetical protein